MSGEVYLYIEKYDFFTDILYITILELYENYTGYITLLLNQSNLIKHGLINIQPKYEQYC